MVRRGPLLITALGAAIGGAAIYLVALPALWRMSWPYGVLFAALGIAQLVTAGAAFARPVRRRLHLAAAAALSVIVVRTLTGLLPDPNPWVPVDSVIGFVDLICVGLESIAAVGLIIAATFKDTQPSRPSWARRVAAVVGVAPLVVLVVLGSAIGVAAGSDTFRGAGVVSPRDLPAGQRSTVEYCRPDGVPLSMDIYTPPATRRTGKAPVALYLHGGGFVFGNRRSAGVGAALANHAGALFSPLQQGLNARGFVVASADYRLPPATSWPAQLEDVKCAVRFLRAHATELGVDPARIGVWGSSAGGQLSCLLALAGPDAGFDKGQYAEQPSNVQAVVDMFGCVDLTDIHDSSPVLRLAIRLALGSSSQVLRAASPGRYLTRPTGIPPFLILQGTEDPEARPRHAASLLQQLQAAGAHATLVEVQGAAHGLNTPSQRPTPGQLTTTVIDFFTSTLA
jgi:acetyl esterase/lipase